MIKTINNNNTASAVAAAYSTRRGGYDTKEGKHNISDSLMAVNNELSVIESTASGAATGEKDGKKRLLKQYENMSEKIKDFSGVKPKKKPSESSGGEGDRTSGPPTSLFEEFFITGTDEREV